jgi:2-keto-4-pentenoate hydratase/2-oxohepta-3-ene-1,7-dioic acid hydratase in catechol pathway
MDIVLNNVFFSKVGKVVCVGRNYAEHAKELNNDIPDSPLLFMKPSSSVVSFDDEITIPKGQGDVHHELELAILIGRTLKDANNNTALEAISGIGLALDLTLRDVQNQLKKKGHSWERAKAFDGACPLSSFLSLDTISNMENIDFCLYKNTICQQQGNSGDMLFSINELIVEITKIFTLNKGDVVLTGTPAGVSRLKNGDELRAVLGKDMMEVSARVL